jgi:hypothetical protein
MSMFLLTFAASLILCATLALAFRLIAYYVSTGPRRNSLRNLAGPPVQTLFANHMILVLECVLALRCLLPYTHHRSVVRLGPPIPMPGMLRNMVGTYV